MDYQDPESHSIPGILVPQQVYSPPPGQQPAQLLPPLRFFVGQELGVNLQTARDFPLGNILRDPNAECVLSNSNNRATLRIIWPGYDRWHHENSLDARPGRTLEQVARQVAARIWEFHQAMSTVPGGNPDWDLRNVPFRDLYLVELRNVSQGSWQPVLCRRVD